ncbi:MAG: HEPN domain-containing protein [Janthinobacterium lividum]
MRKANRALTSAQSLLDEFDTEGACNRAYFAMFNAAHAALWATGRLQAGTVIKTHSGLISSFALELVKSGVIDASQSRALGRVQKTRAAAD